MGTLCIKITPHTLNEHGFLRARLKSLGDVSKEEKYIVWNAGAYKGYCLRGISISIMTCHALVNPSLWVS